MFWDARRRSPTQQSYVVYGHFVVQHPVQVVLDSLLAISGIKESTGRLAM